MAQETIYKTVYQYNKEPISVRDMARLQEIAEDCRKVRNFVYDRYGGIGGLPKIYPGYTVQNEMTKSGLRERLGLPSVFFYLSIFDALGDIKSQWTRIKSRIEKNIQVNAELTAEDRHYLRFVMKQSRCFEAVLGPQSRCGCIQAGSVSAQAGQETPGKTSHRYGGWIYHFAQGIQICRSWDIHFHEREPSETFHSAHG